jgi:ribonucleoside-diphosphate reductase beta chain
MSFTRAKQPQMRGHPHLYDPRELYRHSEREQWNRWTIDLGTDQEQSQGALTAEDKGLVCWALSSLMVAEERITTKFAGLVMAAESEEAAALLASQQVDEARHMQFYARFRDQVLAEPSTIAGHVAHAHEQLGESFAVIFDQALVSAHDRLLANPRDTAAKVEYVTTYHLVIKSTLGLTAFEFITRYLTRSALLPGFVDGYSHSHHDEEGHIGYGVWYLRVAAGRDPAVAQRILAKLRELVPAVVSGLAPPDRGGTDWEALGASGDEIRGFVLSGLSRRLRIIGVSAAMMSRASYVAQSRAAGEPRGPDTLISSAEVTKASVTTVTTSV